VLQESFGGAVTGAASPVADPSDTKITYSRSGVSCGLIAGKTLLESAEANGILIPSGCRQGSCGTCATRLISGNVEMNQPEALTEELRTNGYILPCVSRALGNVVLDA
jgi:ferredoxin